MKIKNQFYAVQAITNIGEKLLCWKEGRHFYFATKERGFKSPPAPTLFKSRKDTKIALDGVPKKGGNIKQFFQVIEAKKVKIVTVNVSLSEKLVVEKMNADFISKANMIKNEIQSFINATDNKMLIKGLRESLLIVDRHSKIQ